MTRATFALGIHPTPLAIPVAAVEVVHDDFRTDVFHRKWCHTAEELWAELEAEGWKQCPDCHRPCKPVGATGSCSLCELEDIRAKVSDSRRLHENDLEAAIRLYERTHKVDAGAVAGLKKAV